MNDGIYAAILLAVIFITWISIMKYEFSQRKKAREKLDAWSPSIRLSDATLPTVNLTEAMMANAYPPISKEKDTYITALAEQTAQSMFGNIGEYIASDQLTQDSPQPVDQRRDMHNVNSPTNDEDKLEQRLVQAGATAPRLSPDDLRANIAHVEYVKHVSHTGQVLRWCIMTTQSGYAHTSRPSVSVSPENDRPAIGEDVAYQNAFNDLWPLMGYELKQRLSQA